MSIHLTSFQSQKTGVSLVPHASSPLRNSPRKPQGSDHGPGGGVRHRPPTSRADGLRSQSHGRADFAMWGKDAATRAKRNGARKDEARVSKRDRTDEALAAEMRSNPDGTIGDWAMTISVSRTTCVSALHRLRDAGLAESAEGRWKLTKEPPQREPPPQWVRPLNAERASAFRTTAEALGPGEPAVSGRG
jgi:hypothetical protein